MKILIFNTGSSSVKFTCFRLSDQSVLAGGIVERIGQEGTRLRYQNPAGDNVEKDVRASDSDQAVRVIDRILAQDRYGVIRDRSEIAALGHRIVHGGEKLASAVVVDDRVKVIIRECFELAPLHNPPGLKSLEAAQELFPDQPHVAVFDTAFHDTIPEHVFLYALPYELYAEDKIRRYGFHGLSHRYVAFEAARFLNRRVEDLKIITCHLGHGCSITAVDGGRSVDTSMGFTPLEGLVMGTRSGDVDPAVILYLIEHKGLDPAAIGELLNKRSGLWGLAGLGSSDLREIIPAGLHGHHRAEVALKSFCYRIRKYIGAYYAAMGGTDAIVFTAGIGENSALVRRMACDGLPGPNNRPVRLDPKKNEAPLSIAREVQDDRSGIKVLVIPTNEEREILDQTIRLLEFNTGPSAGP